MYPASFLILAASVLPSVYGSIAIGEQARGSSINYHVAWQEGLNPCVDDVAFAPANQRLCNQNFSIDGTEYYLVGCNSNNENPQRLRFAHTNALYGNCQLAEKTISCGGATHNVIKHYLCIPP